MRKAARIVGGFIVGSIIGALFVTKVLLSLPPAAGILLGVMLAGFILLSWGLMEL